MEYPEAEYNALEVTGHNIIRKNKDNIMNPKIQQYNGEQIAFKVVTTELKSLGLRRNPNILTYPIGEWYILPDSWIEEGRGDWGGMWLSRVASTAKRLRAYMKENHNTECRIFKSYIGRVLYCNSYRLKTDRVEMFEELTGEEKTKRQGKQCYVRYYDKKLKIDCDSLTEAGMEKAKILEKHPNANVWIVTL